VKLPLTLSVPPLPLSCLPFAQAKTKLLKDKAKTAPPLPRPVGIANCVRVKQDVEVKARSHCVNQARHRVPSSRTGRLSHKLFLVIFFPFGFSVYTASQGNKEKRESKMKGKRSCRVHLCWKVPPRVVIMQLCSRRLARRLWSNGILVDLVPILLVVALVLTPVDRSQLEEPQPGLPGGAGAIAAHAGAASMLGLHHHGAGHRGWCRGNGSLRGWAMRQGQRPCEMSD